MAKIPVGATIAHAYRFTFGGFARIFGVMWLPWAILAAGSFLLRPQVQALMAAMSGNMRAGIGGLLLLIVPFYLISFIFVCMQVIGIARLALGQLEGPVWFYFSLGKPVWRLIGSILLLIVALIIGYFAIILGGVVVVVAGHFVAKMINQGWVAGVFALLGAILFVALWCGYVYSVVRLTFLLVPVIAANGDDFALERSWALGKGNFWRSLAVMLVILLPFMILEFLFIFKFMLGGMSFLPPAHATPDQLAAFNAAMLARQAAATSWMFDHWYLTFPVGGIVMLLLYGLSTGAQVFAYRAVTEEPEPMSSLR